MTSLSIQDLCLLFLADLGEDTWQTGTGINENEIVVEVTMAVNPVRWRPTLSQPPRKSLTCPRATKAPQLNFGATCS